MDDIKVVEPGDLPPADVIDPVSEPDDTAAVSEADLADVVIPTDVPAHEEPAAASVPMTGASFDRPRETAAASEDVASIRRPPQSIESEQAVLGGLLLDNNAFDQVADVIGPDDFYRRDHRLIFEKIQAMCIEGQPADVVTVYGALQAEGKAQEVGGLQYLNSLATGTPSAANIRRYSEIVRDRSILRQLVTAGDTISTTALAPQTENISQLLDQAQQLVFAIDEKSNKGKKGFRPLNELAANVTRELQALYQEKSREDVTGLSTGFIQLDRMTSGLQKGDLIIVAGRPSMGKTSFAMNIAEYAGMSLKMPVAVFSMEMTSEQLAKRLISSVGRIDAQKMRKARFEDSDWQHYTEVVARMNKLPFYIDDTQGLTVNEVRARARRLAKNTGPLSLIVVDYLQLMSGSARFAGTDNRAAEIAEISRGLKGLAKEMNVPVIALSQLNRGVDARTDRRPVMSDLRESGAIEQDADMILFIYRDEVYHKDTPDKAVAEIIIGKQRNGPTGTVRMRFDGQFTRFDNLAEDVSLPPEMQQ